MKLEKFEIKVTVKRKNIKVFKVREWKEIFWDNVLIVVNLVLSISLFSSIWLGRDVASFGLLSLLGFSLKILHGRLKRRRAEE